MKLFGPSTEERLLLALERIAHSLEFISGERKEREKAPDFSGVSYVDDREEVKKELLREAYRMRTGIDLPEGELPPHPGGWLGDEEESF